MEKQKIKCTVHNCKHCDCDYECCQLEEIKVCDCSPEKKKEATMCDSYVKCEEK